MINSYEVDIRPAIDADAKGVADVFNYFVENSFASYSSTAVDDSFYHRLKSLADNFPFYIIETREKLIVGFALIRRHHIADTLSRTAEATIFILPEYTHLGIGGRLMELLIADARKLGIDTILGSASSRNEQSLNFQKKYGFSECGRFVRVGKKFGHDYDMVWMQRFI